MQGISAHFSIDNAELLTRYSDLLVSHVVFDQKQAIECVDRIFSVFVRGFAGVFLPKQGDTISVRIRGGSCGRGSNRYEWKHM